MDLVGANRDWLQRRAFQAAPLEACGFILETGAVVEIPNTATNPMLGFSMSRLHLERYVPNPAEVAAIWHTHPRGISHPSNADMQSMWWGAWDWIYVIATAHDVFQWPPDAFVPQPDSFWHDFAAQT